MKIANVNFAYKDSTKNNLLKVSTESIKNFALNVKII